MQGAKPRFYVLDLVRGLAVFLMLLSHSVYFFHARDSQFLLNVETMGNIFCYIAFLVVSGATTYVSFLHHSDDPASRHRFRNRLLVLLVSYYLLALFVMFKDLIATDGLGKLKIIADVLLLRNLPSYTEYIVPFIIYPLLLLPLRSFVSKNARNLYRLMLTSLLCYAFGYLLYRLPSVGYFEPWKALLAGSDGYYRFPILQYLPVYLFGVYWGHELLTRDTLRAKQRFALNISLVSVLICLLIYYFGRGLGWDWQVLMKRWPPSVFFLSWGILLTFLMVYIFYFSRMLSKTRLLRDFLLVIGQNAYAFFWSHIFLLTIYKMMDGALISSVWLFFVVVIVFWILCFALAVILPFNYKFALNFIKYSHEEAEEFWEKSRLTRLQTEAVASSRSELNWLRKFYFPADDGSRGRRRLIKKRHLVFGVSLGLIAAILISPVILDEAKSVVRNRQVVTWWDESYAYRQNLTINNKNAFTNLPSDQLLEFSFDHQAMVKDRVAKADGGDIRLLYFSGSSYQQLDYKLENSWDKNNTTLIFKPARSIAAGKRDNAYYLYFGNYLASGNQAALDASRTTVEYSIQAGEITTLALNLKIDKRWHLLGQNDKSENLEITVTPNVSLSSQVLQYRVINSNVSGELQYDGVSYHGSIPLSSLSPGSYQIQASVNENGTDYTSQKEAFFVSYPLYVAWTIDWEGYDASSSYLAAMNDIAAKYKLPMTHFFNPRTTITSSISDSRKAYLLSWLKDRLDRGDDIALHLHMFYDLAEAAGITPLTEPRWSDGNDGYDVPVTAYSADDLKKIVQRALDEMAVQGLPRPDIFRAGAWFADSRVLQTMNEMGFLADSSGRTAYKFGRKNMAGPWNLQATTQPYLPAQSDQNSSSLYNATNILEIPNNGADSYWFSADEMIGRFKANFSGLALDKLTEVTFLSHPHWFSAAEQQKISKLFDYVSQYRYDGDNGPVIFVTSDQIYQAWMKQ